MSVFELPLFRSRRQHLRNLLLQHHRLRRVLQLSQRAARTLRHRLTLRINHLDLRVWRRLILALVAAAAAAASRILLNYFFKHRLLQLFKSRFPLCLDLLLRAVFLRLTRFHSTREVFLQRLRNPFSREHRVHLSLSSFAQLLRAFFAFLLGHFQFSSSFGRVVIMFNLFSVLLDLRPVQLPHALRALDRRLLNRR